jgi:hypothetical protein
MKLLIGGKSRNIYKRKDGSAYYKSGGENVDASYMFKKNGDLKKQYIGGVKGNLAKVEKKKRSSKCAKQILGGVGEGISFDPIKVESEKLVNEAEAINDDLAKKELEKLCYIALNGLSIKSNELKEDNSKDKIKISIGNTQEKFKEYVDNNIGEATRRLIYGDAADDSAKLAAITADFGKADSELKKLGFTEIKVDVGITVTRAYVLNKILLCFEGADPLADQQLTPGNDIADRRSTHINGVLKDAEAIIDPQSGEFKANLTISKQILENIVSVLKKCMNDNTNKDELHTIVRNLHTILFKYEKIGAPAPEGAAYTPALEQE